MNKKLRIQIVRVTLILSVIYLMYTAFTSVEPKEIKVDDYIPKKEMVKIFNGGFEDGGYVEVIDKIQDEFYQKKTIDNGAKGVVVYQIKNNEYKLVYNNGEVDKFKANYIDEKQNANLILLREPLKQGVSWINPDNSTYKILAVDEKIQVLGEETKVVKLRYRKDNSEYYIYIGKGLGIVGIDSEMGNSRLVKIEYNVKEYLEKTKN